MHVRWNLSILDTLNYVNRREGEGVASQITSTYYRSKEVSPFQEYSFIGALLYESSVGLSSTTNPSLGVAIPVPAQAPIYSCKRQSHLGA